MAEYDASQVGFSLDDKLRSVTKHTHTGSGTSFQDYLRDHSWEVPTRRAAERLQKRLLNVFSRHANKMDSYSVSIGR